MLDIPIPRIGICGFDAQGNKGIVLVHEAERLETYFVERFGVQNKVIGRCYDQRGQGILLLQFE